MPTLEQVQLQLRNALNDFLDTIGRDTTVIDDETDLICDLGLESDQGLDLVLDLETVLGVGLPADFNPIVHPSGTRGMKFRELAEWVHKHMSAQGGDS